MSVVTRIPKLRRQALRNRAFVEWRGQRYYLGPWGDEETELNHRKFVRENVLADVIKASDPEGVSEVRVRHLILRYLRLGTSHCCADERATLASIGGELVEFCGEVHVNHFGPSRLREFREHIVETGNRRSAKKGVFKAVSRGYVNTQIKRIRRMFRWGVEHELVPAAVLEGLRAVSPLKEGSPHVVETDAIEPPRMRAVAKSLQHTGATLTTMIRLMWLTGMRPNEVCQMRGCELDRSESPWQFRPSKHKNKKRKKLRIVMIGPRAQKLLVPFLDRDPQAYCFTPAEGMAQVMAKRRAARKTKVQPSQRNRAKPGGAKRFNERYTTDSLRQAIGYACAKAGVPQWNPNQLRHARATAVRRRYGLEGSQVILGHAKLDTTQVYTARDMGFAARIAEEMG